MVTGCPWYETRSSRGFCCKETAYNHHMICNKCNVHTVPLPREQAGYFTCMPCARQVQRPKGVMVCTGKVGSEIQVLSAETYANNKKYLVSNGPRSVLKNFVRSVCS
jgi:hypothetical protein